MELVINVEARHILGRMKCLILGLNRHYVAEQLDQIYLSFLSLSGRSRTDLLGPLLGLTLFYCRQRGLDAPQGPC